MTEMAIITAATTLTYIHGLTNIQIHLNTHKIYSIGRYIFFTNILAVSVQIYASTVNILP